jgi:sulfate adenylyltransferase
MSKLIDPHGGTLCNLLTSGDALEALREEAIRLPSVTLSERQLCDIELIMNGAFSPLRGFLNEKDYQSVVKEMRLADGTVWPMPITLDVDEKQAKELGVGSRVALRDHEGLLVAVMTVESSWKADKTREAEEVFGTTDDTHPAVDYLMHKAGDWYLGGKLEGVALPKHHDFLTLRNSPAELREHFQKLGWNKVVAFQTRNPLHRAHKELTLRAAKEVGASLLIHPVVGMTKPGDVDHYTRVRCYRKILARYPERTSMLSLLPLAMRMGGPREALWHAIIRKNYGCTHFIIGRDHAGPGNDSTGKPIYGPYDAQEVVAKYSEEIGVGIVEFKMMVYVEDKAEYYPVDEVPEGARTLNISGTELRRRLAEGLEIPEWFSYPEVVEELRHSYPPRNKQGFTVFFTGLSGSGKSTLANALLVHLLEEGSRPVTLLDGDIVRTHLSSELGFSKEHRDLNIRRIAFVASEITKNGGIALCAPIAPYKGARRFGREIIGHYGGFIEVHVSTPLETCEKRDTKGLYAKARQGIIKGFTGIDDPYEIPENPELRVDTTNISVEESVQQILLHLEREGYLSKS